MRAAQRSLFFVVLLLAAGCGEDALPPSLAIVTHILPEAVENERYAALLEAENGTPPYRFTLESGALPNGLALDGARIEGTPREIGTFAFEVRVEDEAEQSRTGAISLRVRPVEENTPGPSCDTPAIIALADEPVRFEGTFFDLYDRESAPCGGSSGVEAVAALTLAEVADLEISPVVNGPVLYVRKDSCTEGQVLACDNDPLYLPHLDPGTYYLFVERPSAEAERYEVLVSKLPATPAPAHDSCASAELVVFEADVASLRANFTAAEDDQSFGSCTRGRALYYAIDLDRPSKLRITSAGRNVDLELFRESCDAPLTIACEYSDALCEEDTLPPGRYFLAVSTTTDEIKAVVNVFIERHDPPNVPPNNACSSEQLFVLDENNTLLIEGSFAGATDTIELEGLTCDSYDEGKDLFYALELEQRSDITLEPLSSTEAQLALFAGGCATGLLAECIELRRGRHKFYGVPPGRLGIVVEQTESRSDNACVQSSEDRLGFTVEVRPSPPAPANDLCTRSTTIALSAIGAAVSISGTTIGAGDDVSTLLCPERSERETAGPDVFYLLELDVPGRLRVSGTTPARLIVSLHGATCPAPGSFACADLSAEALETVAPIPAGPYYLRVDHDRDLDFDPTDFLLNVELLP